MKLNSRQRLVLNFMAQEQRGDRAGEPAQIWPAHMVHRACFPDGRGIYKWRGTANTLRALADRRLVKVHYGFDLTTKGYSITNAGLEEAKEAS